jgi:NDP-sugar pyrophosphorylase family protein
MQPLTNHRAKPLVPLCGAPLLDQAVALIRAHGIDSAVVNAHHLPEGIEGWAKRQPIEIEVSKELPDILGTGGGLRAALAILDDSFVVVNGDILCDVDLTALLNGLSTNSASACMALRPIVGDDKYGVVAADESDVVVDLVGLAQAEPNGNVNRDTHFTGIHALTKEAVELLPPEQFSCVARGSYVKMVPNRKVKATRHTGIWEDAGNPESYLAANMSVLNGRLKPPLDTLPLAAWAIIDGREHGSREAVGCPESCSFTAPFWIGHGATIQENCSIAGSIIGDRAELLAGSTLERSVVWDTCTVAKGSSHSDAIIYDGGVYKHQSEN